LNNLILLKDYINRNKGRQIKLPVTRIKEDGLFSWKHITGIVGSMGENSFHFYTCQDLSSSIYEEPIDLVVRFDNILGIIPMHPELDCINPFIISSCYSNYLRSLIDMRTLLQECVGYSCNMLYKGKHNFLRIEGEIVKTNKSNVEYKNFRSVVYNNSDNFYKIVELNPGNRITLYINHLQYLIEVSTIGVKNQINQYDDED